MKKLVFVLGVTFLLFAGCETKLYSVLIKNGSSKTVTYTYDGSPYTLASGASQPYEVKAYTLPPAEIKDEHGIASIDMERVEDTFTFVDAEPMEMSILNTLSVEVKRIKADNYISYGDSFLVSMKERGDADGGDIIESDLYIYTDNPDFTLEADSEGVIEPPYPIIFDWKIIDNKMFVTIR